MRLFTISPKNVIPAFAGTTGVLLLLTGCSLSPLYERPKIDLPEEWNGAELQEPTGKGWTAFNSYELTKLIDQALQQNYDLEAGLQRIEQARANAKIAGSSLWPSVTANASAGRQRNEPDGGPNSTTDNWKAGGAIAYELDLWGKNRAGTRAADIRAKATRFDFKALELVTVSDTATAYSNLLASKERVAVAQHNYGLAKELLDIVQARFNEGRANGLELSQQKAAVASAEAALAQIRDQRQAFSNQLAVLTGTMPQGFVVKAEDLSGLVAPEIGIVQPADLLDTRPDIQRAEAEMAAANFDIGVARAAFLPSLTLGLDAALTALPASNPATLVAGAAGSAVAPIFRGGALQGGLDQAKARHAELIANYRQTILVALQETQNALSAVDTAKQRETLLQSARAESENAYKLARDRYEAGAIDYQTLLDTQRALLSAQDAEVVARLDRLTSTIQLYKAMGGAG